MTRGIRWSREGLFRGLIRACHRGGEKGGILAESACRLGWMGVIVLCAGMLSPEAASADKVNILGIRADTAEKTLLVSVSGATPGAKFSFCAELITGQRQCNFKTGTVGKDGTFGVSTTGDTGKVIASFSFSITVTDPKTGTETTQNWRGISDTNDKTITVPSEAQKLSKLGDLQNPTDSKFSPSSSSPFRVESVGLFDDFLLTNGDTTPYQLSSVKLYDGLDLAFFHTPGFDSAAAISTGMLGLDLVNLLIAPAGGEADPVLSFTVGPVILTGYELLVVTGRPILDIDAGILGSPITFSIAQRAETAIPEANTVTLLGVGTLGLAGYAWRRSRRGKGARHVAPPA